MTKDKGWFSSLIPMVTKRYITFGDNHSRNVDLRKVSNQEAPKHPKVLGGAIRHVPHREAFIPDVKSQVSKAGWQGYKSTSTSEGYAPRVPN
jgi:hypothetical protein